MSEAFTEANLSGVNPLTTKGDIFTFDTANSRLAIGSNTQKLVADSTTATGLKWADDTQFIVKAADQSFTSTTTTLTNVTSLLIPLAASTSYLVEVIALLNSDNTNADYKFGWTYPTSATMFWGRDPGSDGGNPNSGGAAASGWTTANVASTPAALLIQTDTLSIGACSGTHGAIFWAIVRNSTNAGNLQLQAAQDTAQAGTVTQVLMDSLMRWRKLQ